LLRVEGRVHVAGRGDGDLVLGGVPSVDEADVQLVHRRGDGDRGPEAKPRMDGGGEDGGEKGRGWGREGVRLAPSPARAPWEGGGEDEGEKGRAWALQGVPLTPSPSREPCGSG